MDFQSIISTAQQNIASSNGKGKYYSTKFEPPKKMTKEKRLSAGIQKFLEQKKREDEEMAEKARQKKLELVARRDPKEQRKIEKSLKVIKSSRKFHSGDASLDENSALNSEQPDEDDYGYTSNISDQFHKKLMEKYQNIPEDKKFSSGSGRHKALSKEEIQTTKDRVKNALASKDEEPHFRQGPQQRTSKLKAEKLANLSARSTSKAVLANDKGFIKPKPKLKQAPIVDFQQLLKLAEQKQHEEITIEVPTKKEPERLLTSKEKREQEELEAARRAKSKPNRIPKLGSIPKVNDSMKNDRNNNESSSKKPTPSAIAPSKPVGSSNRSVQSDKFQKPSQPTSSSGSKLRDALQPQKLNVSSSTSKTQQSTHKVPSSSSRPGSSSSSSVKAKEAPSRSIGNGQRPNPLKPSSNQLKPKPTTSSVKEATKSRDFPPKDLMRSREFPPKDLMRSREFPPKDLMRSREFPPKDLMRSREFPPKDLMGAREFPPRDTKRPSQQQISRKRRVIEDEESDYDSEMDDFIDDEDAVEDYSSEIKKIFGYDKSRYRDEDFDDSQMESDYRTVMREEFISKKMGILEDLEDMKMEAEEKKRKDMKKKRKL